MTQPLTAAPPNSLVFDIPPFIQIPPTLECVLKQTGCVIYNDHASVLSSGLPLHNVVRMPMKDALKLGPVTYPDHGAAGGPVAMLQSKVGSKLIFLPLSERLDYDDVAAECAAGNLAPAQPLVLIDHNIRDPDFLRKYKNMTIWKNEHGHWCHLSFSQSIDRTRVVSVDSYRGKFGDGWYVACVLK